MISPAPYHVMLLGGEDVEDVPAVRLGVAEVVLRRHVDRAGPGDRHQPRVDPDGDEAGGRPVLRSGASTIACSRLVDRRVVAAAVAGAATRPRGADDRESRAARDESGERGAWTERVTARRDMPETIAGPARPSGMGHASRTCGRTLRTRRRLPRHRTEATATRPAPAPVRPHADGTARRCGTMVPTRPMTRCQEDARWPRPDEPTATWSGDLLDRPRHGHRRDDRRLPRPADDAGPRGSASRRA